jgi:hypothetical protein
VPLSDGPSLPLSLFGLLALLATSAIAPKDRRRIR